MIRVTIRAFYIVKKLLANCSKLLKTERKLISRQNAMRSVNRKNHSLINSRLERNVLPLLLDVKRARVLLLC